ncbi:hypothetical protein [Rhizohabitans arisaemae]|uniref:hypothetical protein n=1 Tax=Rhizohabitans arisaemae TaxID=2720610 RepID=UPI0024B1301A|nr:hypothetical protein [Rhizohabitans arisaemae]
MITDLAARLRAIAEGLPVEPLESARERVETAASILAPIADGALSPLPQEGLAHLAEALARLEDAYVQMRKGHNLVLLYAATLLGSGWIVAPPRHHGAPFNADYEGWVRRECGGPADREYLVVHGGKSVMFDAARVEQRDGVSVEVLVDAKGRYDQFIDKGTGDFYSRWAHSSRSGLPKLLDRALDQVVAGAGRPVEWWCAERAFARLLNRAFNNDPRLEGQIRAVYRPKPPE